MYTNFVMYLLSTSIYSCFKKIYKTFTVNADYLPPVPSTFNISKSVRSTLSSSRRNAVIKREI